MDAAIVTVGEELLAGDIENTNATWLASRLSDQGVTVREIAVIPDDVDVIADRVGGLADDHDVVIVTGGLGGTPDDVTIDGVAGAFGRPVEVNDEAYRDVKQTIEGVERDYELRIDFEAEGELPAGARPLLNTEGLSPGCVVENVYVLPGIPGEMKAMFEQVADDFAGDRYTRTTYTSRPESNIASLLAEARDGFDVDVGSYPDMETGEKRITVRGDDPAQVDEAYAWLTDRL